MIINKNLINKEKNKIYIGLINNKMNIDLIKKTNILALLITLNRNLILNQDQVVIILKHNKK